MTTTDQIIKALCNTLVNSLWQGIILAAVAGIIVIATRKSTSAMRYNLLTGALALFAIASVVTFCMQFNFTAVNASAVTGGSNHLAFQGPITLNQPLNAPVVAQSGNLLATIGDYLNSYHNTIVLIWFMIICIKSIQFGVGLYGTHTLKTVKVSSPDQFWKERAMQLACITGVKQVIEI